MTGSLTSAQIEQYRNDGILFPFQAVSADEMTAIYERMQAFKAARPEDAAEAFAGYCHLMFPWLYDLVANETILDAVESLIGPDIICWQAGFFNKEAGDGTYVSWHQDSTYWGLEPADILTAWVAFTPSRVESGCMKMLPGTHREGQLAHEDTFENGNLLSRGQKVAGSFEDERGLDVELEPGQFSLHDVRIVHGSGPNAATWPRYGFAIRYIPTHVKQVGARTYATLVRGTDRYGHFELVDRPEEEFADERRALRKTASDVINQILFSGAEDAIPAIR